MKFTAAFWFTALLATATPTALLLAQTPEPTPETHCLMLPLDPARRAQQADLVVEGEVLDARGFWDQNHRRIYTAHRIRVFKTFKGTAPAELTMLTEGGTVGLNRQVLTNTLSLAPGQQGVLFLYRAPFGEATAGPAWAAYGSQQGFIGYDLMTGGAAEPFRQYPRVDEAFYRQLSAATGQARQDLQPNARLNAAFERQAQARTGAKGTAPVITGVAPLTVTAGTDAVVTVSGSGFGAARGSGVVEFYNADQGGRNQQGQEVFVRARDSDYLSWSDTQIRVRVPSNGVFPDGTGGSPAGTGPVRVVTNELLQGRSAQVLTVAYAISNVQEQNSRVIVRPAHINQNNTGGYTLRFDPTFASNTAAGQAFRRALETWRCQTGINWEVGAPRTTRGVADDEDNAIGFDSGTDELPDRVLARTTSYYLGCFQPDNTVTFWVDEIDMQFDQAANWQFGPARPTGAQFDFETVAVHELGHAHQLGHLILPSAVMHYAVAARQVSRQISPESDVAGGRFVLRSRSFRELGCAPAPMLPAPLTALSTGSQSTGTEVQWTTRDECFISEFVVERSVDTTASWQSVGTVAAGASNGAYRYLDTNPIVGLSYYRLRLRRPDGSFDNTPGVLTSSDPVTAIAGVQLYPNPVQGDQLNLLFAGSGNGNLFVYVYDAIGRYRRGQILPYQASLNRLTFNVNELRAGWYVLRWRDEQGRSGTLSFAKVD